MNASADPLKDAANRVGALFKKDADARIRATRYTKGLLITGGALAAGLAQLPDVQTAVAEHSVSWKIVLGFCGAIAAFAGGVWSLLAEENAPEALEEARKALEEARRASVEAEKATSLAKEKDLAISDLRFEEEWAKELFATSNVMREAVEKLLIANGPATDSDLQRMLDGVSRSLDKLLSFEAGEYWSLAVLRYSHEGPHAGRLTCAAHHRADRSHELKTHRSWGVGEGIAGHAFLTNREIVVGDAADPERGGWLHIPKSMRADDDGRRYRSMAAIPVNVIGVAEPWGVVVATSDRPERFTMDASGHRHSEVEPLRLLAGMVALAAAPHYSHKSTADTQSDGSPPPGTGSVVSTGDSTHAG